MEGFPQSIAWSRGYDVAKAAGPPVPTAASTDLRLDAVLDRAVIERASIANAHNSSDFNGTLRTRIAAIRNVADRLAA
jgi:hypothetical protein